MVLRAGGVPPLYACKGLHGRRMGYLEFRFGLERRFEFPFEVF